MQRTSPNRRQIPSAVAASPAALSVGDAKAMSTPIADSRAVPTSITRGYAPGLLGQIHYRRSGPEAPSGKPPLLCLHPSPMSSLVFEDFLPQMGRDRECLGIDTPGYGASAAPAATPSIEDYADAVGALADHLGLKQVDLFGYHTGCAIALALALKRPGLVGRVVMNSALMFTPEEVEASRKSFRARASKPLDAQIPNILESWASWRKFWRDVPDEARAWALFWESQRNLTRSMWGFIAVFEYDFPAALARLDKPLLVFNPEDDLNEITARAAPLMRQGRIHPLPGWTHGFLNAHPGEVAGWVRDFLDS